MALAQDGPAASGVITAAATNTVVASTNPLTTTNPNDVIIAFVFTTDGGAATGPYTVTSMSGTGIVWDGAARKAVSVTTNVFAKNNFEEWRGVAAGTLSGVSVTANLSGNAVGAVIIAFAVSGANTSSSYDPNGSLPASATNLNNTPPTVPAATISTSNANDFIFAAIGSDSGTTTAPYGDQAGFTNIVNGTFFNTTSFNTVNIDSEYEIVSSTQSGLSVGFTGSVNAWIMIVDAIQAVGAAPGINIWPYKT